MSNNNVSLHFWRFDLSVAPPIRMVDWHLWHRPPLSATWQCLYEFAKIYLLVDGYRETWWIFENHEQNVQSNVENWNWRLLTSRPSRPSRPLRGRKENFEDQTDPRWSNQFLNKTNEKTLLRSANSVSDFGARGLLWNIPQARRDLITHPSPRQINTNYTNYCSKSDLQNDIRALDKPCHWIQIPSITWYLFSPAQKEQELIFQVVPWCEIWKPYKANFRRIDEKAKAKNDTSTYEKA